MHCRIRDPSLSLVPDHPAEDLEQRDSNNFNIIGGTKYGVFGAHYFRENNEGWFLRAQLNLFLVPYRYRNEIIIHNYYPNGIRISEHKVNNNKSLMITPGFLLGTGYAYTNDRFTAKILMALQYSPGHFKNDEEIVRENIYDENGQLISTFEYDTGYENVLFSKNTSWAISRFFAFDVTLGYNLFKY